MIVFTFLYNYKGYCISSFLHLSNGPLIFPFRLGSSALFENITKKSQIIHVQGQCIYINPKNSSFTTSWPHYTTLPPHLSDNNLIMLTVWVVTLPSVANACNGTCRNVNLRKSRFGIVYPFTRPQITSRIIMSWKLMYHNPIQAMHVRRNIPCIPYQMPFYIQNNSLYYFTG